MNEVIQTLQSWWNNNVAFANTAGVTSTVIVMAYAYIGTKLKKKNTAITIDVNQSSDAVNQLTNKIANLEAGLSDATEVINKMADMVFVFANSTAISDGAKKELAKIYSHTTGIFKTVDEVKSKVLDTIEDVVEVAKPSVSYYEKFVEDIKDKG